MAETDLCPGFPGFLSHPGKTHSLKQEGKRILRQSSGRDYSIINCLTGGLTSNHSFGTALWNIRSQSELHQVDVPILNEEKLAFFQGTKWGCILGTATKNCLMDAQRDNKYVI